MLYIIDNTLCSLMLYYTLLWRWSWHPHLTILPYPRLQYAMLHYTVFFSTQVEVASPSLSRMWLWRLEFAKICTELVMILSEILRIAMRTWTGFGRIGIEFAMILSEFVVIWMRTGMKLGRICIECVMAIP